MIGSLNNLTQNCNFNSVMQKKSESKRFNGEGKELSKRVKRSLELYFKQLDGEIPCDIYHMVLKEVELPLLQLTLEHCNGNQSQASQILGMNRGTLRTKLKEYKLL